MATHVQDNKALVRRFIAEANDQNYDRVADLLTEDYTRHDRDTGTNGPGIDPFLDGLQRLHEAFPDSTVHVGRIIAEDDIVAFEGRMTGTHEGTFRGLDPTHERMDVPGNAMHRIRDGRIAETWATWNFLAAMEQLGAIEPPLE